jgi:Ca-activated chloride channel family protein
MPHFANPAYLLLALAVPPLVWWSLRRRGGAVRHPVAGLLAGLPAGRARLARVGGPLLRGLALLLLAVATAGPRWPDLRKRLDTEGIALVLAVDVSGSMAEVDFDWNGTPVSRLEAVQRVFRLFVEGGRAGGTAADGSVPHFEGRPTDLIGLVTFGTRAEAPCPLTLSHSALLRMLADEQPRHLPGERETNLSDAIALGTYRLQSAGPRRRVLVLLTDGEHNQLSPPSGWTPRQAAQVAGNLGVPIYAIDAGGGAAVPEGAPQEAPEGPLSPGLLRAQAVQALKDVAHISQGRYFSARDTAALVEACQAIDRLERDRIESFQYRRYHEGYPWFALASFVLFALALALEMTLWRRVP